MKPNRKISLLVGMAAVCLTTASLKAQELTGSFTLPSETRWQTAVLPAGHYNFTFGALGTGPTKVLTIKRGTKSVAMIVPQGLSSASSSDGSSMLVIEHRVRSLHLAPIGITYTFRPQKNDREFLARRVGVGGVAVVPVSAK